MVMKRAIFPHSVRLLLVKLGGASRRLDLLIADLGLAEVARVAQDSGVDVRLVDLDLIGSHPSELAEAVKRFRPDVVG